MNNWFEAKITYEKEVNQEGMMKKVSESYLLDAVSFTEAEVRIAEQIESRGSFVLNNLRKVRYAEVFLNDKGDRFYKAKVGFITLDEKAGVEKKKYVQMLVQANDIQDALDGINKGMHGTLADYEIASIQETTLMDVFPYEVK
ncbi:DUF4494 domain-containing protein [Porphyromonas cangingivalis]|uniref:Uncharacterized protein n=1 Tax=Porphyromonas cangingivalis TaxID=36874 RepID=A0A099WW52_PORCN|nr:DUF4494 domain-containing protein [Porphyromonas cangingivalis]KGL50024.1 hypothetical protein HQ34_01450 [Porphyromonas cangingivalis]KGN80407.1 hypothetical protein HQ35_05420 [Porphyromonas cangingivalis]SJZ61467.1 protein of unknown function [Porphyromonas cangingivalis]SPY35317.1 Uncharacterised protein [Porphyromonas cangingivalis]VEJ03794.1 Uncharacterised protein [Porphyromonas cangingivalis]